MMHLLVIVAGSIIGWLAGVGAIAAVTAYRQRREARHACRCCGGSMMHSHYTYGPVFVGIKQARGAYMCPRCDKEIAAEITRDERRLTAVKPN